MASSPLQPGSKDKRQTGPRPTALWWVLGALLVLAIGQAFFLTPGGRQIPYSEFKSLVRSGQVAEVAVGDTHIRGVLKKNDDEGTGNFSTTRIDEIVFFHQLSKEQTATIVDIQLGGLLRRLADRKIGVELTSAAKDLVVQEGYDPVYGARPLKRALQRMVLDPLALRVLDGEFGEGDHIVVDAGADRLGFSKRQTIEAGS